jgi:hypothetical protein
MREGFIMLASFVALLWINWRIFVEKKKKVFKRIFARAKVQPTGQAQSGQLMI